ncbi:MAG: alkaline phosphatase family protein [Chloroflexota bacterium]|nr:alkaline phosphatase family protein [Chloroflexota bacterium]
MSGPDRSLKALVIGLDGATFDLLQPMVALGWLPNIERVLGDGAHGILKSTIPPLTAPAWSSFLTGVTPGEHGVFSFQRRLDHSLERAFVDSTAIRAPQLWHWLAQQGLTIGAINVPMTWPPPPMPPGSYLVSGMLTPGTEHHFTNPASLAEPLRSMGYVCDLRVKLNELDYQSTAGVTSITRQLLQVLKTREQAIFWLLGEHPTDLLAAVFETPDRLQHWAWQSIEEQLTNDGGLSRTALHDGVERCYRELDRVVGRLLEEAATPDTRVYFLSDHGFGPLQRRLHVDQWLAEKGWLSYAGSKAILRRRLRMPIRHLRRMLPKNWVRRGRKALAVSRIVDWQHTVAYSGRTMEHAIYINLQGREPYGIVPASQFDSLRQEIAAALRELRDPTTGAPTVQEVALREELYRGPYVDQAPDILFTLAPGYEPTSELGPRGITSNALAEGAGIHQSGGVFMAVGPGIRTGTEITAHNIEDVLPTILYGLELPIPTALQGQVIENVFEENFLQEHPIRVSNLPLDSELAREAAFAARSPEDTEELKRRLEALGYLR